jgi:hypothetical protein
LVFDVPTLDLREDITYETTWERSVDWRDVIDPGIFPIEVAVHFVSRATVDAYGSVILPEIGELEALRVNEVNIYSLTDLTLGLPLPDQAFRNYYWLVPGIGKAVHIISKPETSPPPENFATAKTVLRVFDSNCCLPPLRESVRNLQIKNMGRQVFLTWDREPSATAYEIESDTTVAPDPEWPVIAATTDNFWFDDLPSVAGAKFYRVFWIR